MTSFEKMPSPTSVNGYAFKRLRSLNEPGKEYHTTYFNVPLGRSAIALHPF